ncbi:MAG: class I SAM-dependent methyltransferase [Desulfobacteraceae bacterium]|jgi:2-polyprenyl-3-methyl-5-hydroxy-6-metoxy-1,4-benzoquinol methylase|nr:MAG: class I SAM-dependent methyltransferase [Desulfobacteraceae bacterium]
MLDNTEAGRDIEADSLKESAGRLIGNDDKAGKKYWDKTWHRRGLLYPWPANLGTVRNYARRRLFTELIRAVSFAKRDGCDVRLIEVGCAGSRLLPALARAKGISVTGIDYSLVGAEQARAMLDREGIRGEIFHADMFNPPDELIGGFDVVVSLGLVEHFQITSGAVEALARFLKPGGVIFTQIPNMKGTVGWFQRRLCLKVFDTHISIGPAELRLAHKHAGLSVIECGYFLSTNFGVLNAAGTEDKRVVRAAKLSLRGILMMISFAVWMMEHLLGEFPATQHFSPYINCIAVRPKLTSNSAEKDIPVES